jgi:predicted transcriptional regulator
MPHGITQRVQERKQAILELMADGCKTTAHIMRALNLTHTEAFYVLKRLASEGYIKWVKFGKSAIWCLNEEQYNNLVNTLLQEIRRIIEIHNLKYVYPTRLYKLILKDPKAYKLISQYAPISGPGPLRAFLNHLLHMIYGPPYYRGEKVVYLTDRT